MRIAVVCADRGVPWLGRGGASAHLRAIAAAYASLGHEVEAWVRTFVPRQGALIDTPRGVRALEGPADGFARWVREQGARFAPHLVHERHALDGGVGDVGGAWLLEVNAPLVWEEALFRGGRMHPRRLAREKAVFARPDHVLAVSRNLASWIPRRDVHVIPNGANPPPESHRPRSRSPRPEAPYTLGYEGTFKAWHGLVQAVPTLDRLAAEVGPIQLELAGEGPERAALIDALSSAGVAHTWLGALGPSALAAARSRWDASWSPEAAWPPPRAVELARLAREPVPSRWFAPLKEAEAAAAGLPLWKGEDLVMLERPSTWLDIARGLCQLARPDLGLGAPVPPGPASWDSSYLRS